MKNLKPLLAVPLFCIAPMLAAAGEPAAEDFVSRRSEFVTLVPGKTVELPALRGDDRSASRLAAMTTQIYQFGNWAGVPTYSIGAISGSTVYHQLPNPLNFSEPYTYWGSAQAFVLVPALTPWTQTFAYTTNPSDPYGEAKTCSWQVDVSVVNGACTANVTTSAYGLQGATCHIGDGAWVDPASCKLYLAVGIE
ncbi:hypothetical protein F0U62_41815 [Cystobacter fuscus]|uniref:hypothetical protein n=1 Tax=Cystobacter fuscus TaxID=43 RepID=UPI002B2DFEE6|nr:hypothetical protein F0U62_41815 [Cystobacter fuscus]